MKIIYKFGGAAISTPDNIKHILDIVKSQKHSNLIIVFSAMGKVTNMLEDVVDAYIANQNPSKSLALVKDYHYKVAHKLFEKTDLIYNDINNLFVEIEWVLESKYTNEYEYTYDQIVSIGELLSTRIISAYFEKMNYKNSWIDARDIIKTDDNYKEAKINWKSTESNIKNILSFDGVAITQGFIGSTFQNSTTTLGREGSDFTAAILAYSLDVNELTIWKDVSGIMNADPRFFDKTEKFETIPFEEAIELAFYGAKVIHPKTIQPLQKKSIPLIVRSFLNLKDPGTKIQKIDKIIPFFPSYIVRENQILVSISDIHLDFIVEEHLSEIFLLFSEKGIRVNMMQNSAVSFSVCIDNDKYKLASILKILSQKFSVFYNENLTLYTIRHYTQESIDYVLTGKEIILEQKSRNTVHLVVKPKNLFKQY